MYKQPNYKLKAKVMESGLDKIQRQVSWSIYVYHQELKAEALNDSEYLERVQELKKPYDIDECKLIEELYQGELWKEAYRVNDASYKRTKRLKDRIQSMLNNGDCIFLTLTFRNDVLDSTSKETRRKYIQRFLKDNCIEYVANIDYGKKNEREHYHAVVRSDIKISCKNWIYGNLDFERVRYNATSENEDTDTIARLGKYVNKLTNHAIKETTQKNNMIYSRGK